MGGRRGGYRPPQQGDNLAMFAAIFFALGMMSVLVVATGTVDKVYGAIVIVSMISFSVGLFATSMAISRRPFREHAQMADMTQDWNLATFLYCFWLIFICRRSARKLASVNQKMRREHASSP